MNRGDVVRVRKAKDNPDGSPAFMERIVWEVNETHCYVCSQEQYEKWERGELGTVTINGTVFPEPPWHCGAVLRDVTLLTNL